MRSGNTQTFSINASLVVSNWRDMYKFTDRHRGPAGAGVRRVALFE